MNYSRLFSQVDISKLPGSKDPTGVFSPTASPVAKLLGLAFGLLGALAVLYMVISAFKLIISRGDTQAVGKARNSVIYAAVGILVALAGYSIVSFVINSVTT
jgi:hypothetical protein